MHEFLVAPATADHAMALLPHVRPEDRSEWVAATGLTLRHQLLGAVMAADGFSRAVFVPEVDHPLLLWGASPYRGDPKVGQAWLIASTEAVKWVVALHSLLPSELRLLDEIFPHAIAFADKRNTVHLRWLRWLGFACSKEVPLGPWGLPYLQFERMPDVCTGPHGDRGGDAGGGVDGGGVGGS